MAAPVHLRPSGFICVQRCFFDKNKPANIWNESKTTRWADPAHGHLKSVADNHLSKHLNYKTEKCDPVKCSPPLAELWKMSDINANGFDVNVELPAASEGTEPHPIKITMGAVTLLFHYSESLKQLRPSSQDDITRTLAVSAVTSQLCISGNA